MLSSTNLLQLPVDMFSHYRPLNEQHSMSDLQHSRDENIPKSEQSLRDPEAARSGEQNEPEAGHVVHDKVHPSVGSYDPHRTPRKSMLAIWWAEGLACILGVGAVGATIGTLYPYQGKPLPQWPYAITVNALLSAYMVVLKAAATFLVGQSIALQKWHWFEVTARPLYDFVLHDEATRGPLGAVKFLWQLSVSHIGSWLGCLLILLALFVDPFTQQVLHYVDCSVQVTGDIATIPRSNIFTSKGVHVGAGEISITSAEQAAIQAGIVAPGGQVDFQCSSGNCSFPSYGTMAYCGRCVDVSDSITIRTLEDPETNEENITTSYPGVNTSIPGLSNFFVTDGPTSNFSVFGLSDTGYQFLVGLPIQGIQEPTTIGPYDPATGEAPMGCDSAPLNQTWRCQGYGASNCSLYPCIRMYNASVSNGILKETLIAETPENPSVFGHGLSNTYLSTINASCLTKAERKFLIGQGYTINGSLGWIPYSLYGYVDSREPIPTSNPNSTAIGDFEQAIQKRGCLFAIEGGFDSSLSADYTAYEWPGSLVGYWNPEGGGIAQFEGSQILQTLYNFGDFSFDRTESVFKNISESLTNYMRTNPGNFNATTDVFNFTNPTLGGVYRDKTCLRVEWPWLTLPAALALFSLVFFVDALMSLRHLPNGTRTWKTSPLPLVFARPQQNHAQDDHFQNVEAVQTLEEMERLAKKTNIRLVRGPQGAMLVQ